MGRNGRAITVLAIVTAIILRVYFLDEKENNRLGANRVRHNQDNRQNHNVAEGVRLYVSPEEKRLRNDYQEIFAARAVIILFGADWCQWCKAQAKDLTDPSNQYNIVYWNIDDKKYGALMDEWNLGDSVPVTVLVENGKVVKTWKGYTPWVDIEPFAEKAKKNEDEQKDGFIIHPLDGRYGDFDVDLDGQRRSKRR